MARIGAAIVGDRGDHVRARKLLGGLEDFIAASLKQGV